MMEVLLKDVIEKPISGEWGIDGEGVKVLRTTNFTNEGKLNLTDVVIRNIDRKKIDSKKLYRGDLIIEKSGGSPTQPVGRVVYFDEEGEYLCNNFTSILRPKKEKINSKFLLYILYANHKHGLTGAYQNKTTGIINLQLSRYINEIKIPLPPLATQRKIAAILDEADKVRQLNKQLIEKYDALTQSLFLDMFGDPVTNPKRWELNSLTQFGKFKNGLNYNNSESGNNVRYLGVGDFKSKYKLDGVTHLKFLNLSEMPSDEYFLQDGDIVFVRSNGNKQLVGRCLVVYSRGEKVTFSGFCIRFRLVNCELSVDYLIHVFRVKSFKDAMLQSGRGANIQNINQKILGELKLPVPPIELQNQFAERVQAIEQQKAQAQASLQKSEALFQSLLQRAFKGEIA